MPSKAAALAVSAGVHGVPKPQRLVLDRECTIKADIQKFISSEHTGAQLLYSDTNNADIWLGSLRLLLMVFVYCRRKLRVKLL